MAWIAINDRHVNTDRVDVMLWQEGALYLFFNGDKKPTRLIDPNRVAYIRLCCLLNMLPYKEE